VGHSVRVASALRALSTKAPASIFDDAHLFPDQVLEEDKTGYPVGLPQIREAELWKEGAEGTLLAERAELWWDDGTAEPEWFVDRGSSGGSNGGRPWAVSNDAAVGQLFGMLFFIATVVGGSSYLLGDGLRPAAKRCEHGYPVDMRAQFGLPADGEEEEEEEE